MTIPMLKIPPDQRPRERLWRVGSAALTDAELLAIILRDGTRGESALEMATALLASYGGLDRLAKARPEELARHSGVGVAKAAVLVAAFQLARRAEQSVDNAPVLRDAEDVASVVRPILGDARRERVVVLVCDAQDRLRTQVTVAEGAIDSAPIPIREVLNAVLRHDGRAFAMAHNHPSGDPAASIADRFATATIRDAARTVGLRFLGHVVVAGTQWTDVRPGC
jgi:DNA repair protein RadC